MLKREPLDIDPILARANAATPGPWVRWETLLILGKIRLEGVYGVVHKSHIAISVDEGGGLTEEQLYSILDPDENFDDYDKGDLAVIEQIQKARNLEFCAHARVDVPALCGEIVYLRQGVTELEHGGTKQ